MDDVVEHVRQDLCDKKGWAEPTLVSTLHDIRAHLVWRFESLLTLPQIPLPKLNTHGLQGSPAGCSQKLVVPINSEHQLCAGALFDFMAQLPDDITSPSLAIVDNCAAIVYISIKEDIPALPLWNWFLLQGRSQQLQLVKNRSCRASSLVFDEVWQHVTPSFEMASASI